MRLNPTYISIELVDHIVDLAWELVYHLEAPRIRLIKADLEVEVELYEVEAVLHRPDRQCFVEALLGLG